jgi:hypothetical protein
VSWSKAEVFLVWGAGTTSRNQEVNVLNIYLHDPDPKYHQYMLYVNQLTIIHQFYQAIGLSGVFLLGWVD